MASYQSIDNIGTDDDTYNQYSRIIDDNIDLNNNLTHTLNHLIKDNIIISLAFNINDIISDQISNYFNNNDIDNKVDDLIIDKKIKDDIDISIKDYCQDTTKLKKYYNTLSDKVLKLSNDLDTLIKSLTKKKKSIKIFLDNFNLSDNEKKEIINITLKDVDITKNKINKMLETYVIAKCKLLYVKSIFKNNQENKYICNICISTVDSLYAFDKCGHCFCPNCINHPSVIRSNRCPICRQPYSNKIKLFL